MTKWTAILLLGFCLWRGVPTAAAAGAMWNREDPAVEIRLDGDTADTVVFVADVVGMEPGQALSWSKGPRCRDGLMRDGFKSLEQAYTALDGGSRLYRFGTAGRQVYYAFRVLRLLPGENWISLWGDGPSLAVRDVIGLDMPVGETPGTSSQLTWFKEMGYPFKEEALWLHQADRGPAWTRTLDHVAADHAQLPFGRGVLLELPAGQEEYLLPLVLRMPAEMPGLPLHPRGAYSMLGNPYPVDVALDQLGLKESGFNAHGFNPNRSDEIRIMAHGEGSMASPEARILLDPEDGLFKFWTGGERGQTAQSFVIPAGQAFFVRTSGSSKPWTWTIPALAY